MTATNQIGDMKIPQIPEWLTKLRDIFLEELPDAESTQFAVGLLDTIPVDVNIEIVKWKFCFLLLSENIEKLKIISHRLTDELHKTVSDAVQQVLNLYGTAINTGNWDQDDAEEAQQKAEVAWVMAADAGEIGGTPLWNAALPWWETAEGVASSVADVAHTAAWGKVSVRESVRASATLVMVVKMAEGKKLDVSTAAYWEERKNAYKRYANELLRLLRKEV